MTKCRALIRFWRPVSALGLVALTAAAVLLSPSAVVAQTQGEGTRTADEIAAELANPNTSLGTLTLNVDAKWFGGELAGASDQTSLALLFQPSFPYPLAEGMNLFVRPALPFIVGQPLPTEDGFKSESSAIGDLGFDIAVGKTLSGGWLVVGGMVGTLPTGTNDAISLNRTLLGPEFLVARMSRSVILGLLLTHSWNVSKRDEYDTSVTSGQYFVTVPLKNGWQIASSPLFSYDHKATAGNQWTFPVGGGVSKTSILGRMPWKFSAQYWYSVVSPDRFGTRHQLRVSVAPVVPLPW